MMERKASFFNRGPAENDLVIKPSQILQDEYERFNQDMTQRADVLEAQMREIALSPKDPHARFLRGMMNKIGSLVDFSRAIIAEQVPDEAYSPARLIHIGSGIVMHNGLEKIKEEIPHPGYDDLRDYVTLVHFHETGFLTIAIKGVRLLDFVKNRDLSPADIFRFCMETQRLMAKDIKDANSKDFKGIQKENKGFPMSEYPLVTNSEGVLAAFALTESLFIHPSAFNPYTARRSSVARAAKEARDWLINITEARRKIATTLLSPNNSSEFRQLMGLVQSFLEDDDLRTRTIAILGLHYRSTSMAKDLARHALAYAAHNVHSEFYALLAESIKKQGLVQDLDLSLIADTESLRKAKETPLDWTETRRRVHEIFQNSSQKEYPIDTASIDWLNLPFLQPLKMQVRFNSAQPTRFDIDLEWGEEEDQQVILKFEVKEERFDWSLPNDTGTLPPNSPLAGARNIFMQLTPDILNQVLSQAQEIKRKRSEGRNKPKETELAETQIEGVKITRGRLFATEGSDQSSKKRNKPTKAELRRMRRKGNNEERNGMQQMVEETTSQEESAETPRRHYIKVPKGRDLDELLKNIPANLRQKVIRDMRNHNKHGQSAGSLRGDVFKINFPTGHVEVELEKPEDEDSSSFRISGFSFLPEGKIRRGGK